SRFLVGRAGVAVAENELPVGKGHVFHVNRAHRLHGDVGGRRRRLGLFSAVGRRGCLGGSRGEQVPPAVFASLVFFVARLPVFSDALLGRLVVLRKRDRLGDVPQAVDLDRIRLQVGDGELIDVLEIVGIAGEGELIITPCARIVLDLQRGKTEGAV